MKRWTTSRHSVLACWLLLGFAGRIFVPAGFMVEPGEGVWSVVPCPAVAPELYALAGPGSHPADEGRSGDDAEDRHDGRTPCPVGTFFALAAVVDAVDVAPFRLPEVRDGTPSPTPRVDACEAPPPRPRGPPRTPLHSLLSRPP